MATDTGEETEAATDQASTCNEGSVVAPGGVLGPLPWVSEETGNGAGTGIKWESEGRGTPMANTPEQGKFGNIRGANRNQPYVAGKKQKYTGKSTVNAPASKGSRGTPTTGNERLLATAQVQQRATEAAAVETLMNDDDAGCNEGQHQG